MIALDVVEYLQFMLELQTNITEVMQALVKLNPYLRQKDTCDLWLSISKSRTLVANSAITTIYPID